MKCDWTGRFYILTWTGASYCTVRQDHSMLSRWVFSAELTVFGTHCSMHIIVNSCGADSSSSGYRVQQSVVSLLI